MQWDVGEQLLSLVIYWRMLRSVLSSLHQLYIMYMNIIGCGEEEMHHKRTHNIGTHEKREQCTEYIDTIKLLHKKKRTQ